MATAWTTERPSFAWLWEDQTFADATLVFRLADADATAAQHTTLPVHRAVLASNSEYFRARLLRWADSEPEDASSIEDSPAASRSRGTRKLLNTRCKRDSRYRKAVLALVKKPTINEQGLTQLTLPGRHLTVKETFDSQAECDAARLVVRCMYIGGLAEGMEDPLTLAMACRVAERWAFPSLASKCLQQLVSLPPLQLPMQQLVQVLQTLPDSCALLPEHPQWQERVHTSTVKTYGDVHAIITSAQLRAQFQQLPFMAVQQWAGSNELMVDSENSVVELISLWMAGPAGQACSKSNKQQLSSLVRVQHLSPAYVQGRLLDLHWLDIPGASTPVLSAAACCGFGMLGVLNTPPPAWAAPSRKQLGSAEVSQRTTIRWDVPQQQLADLLAGKDRSAR
ncbi:BTB domain-containing protein, partial [Haematococcus lacustris]